MEPLPMTRSKSLAVLVILLATSGGRSENVQPAIVAQIGTPAAGSGGSIDPRNFGAKCDGKSDDASALVTASSAAAKEGKILSISCRLHLTSGNTTIATPVFFSDAGRLDLGPGSTATLAGSIAAPAIQIFDLSGGKL